MLKILLKTYIGRCIFSGIWFSIAAVIPVVYCLLLFGDWIPKFGGSLQIAVVAPVLFSGFLGSLLGSNILDTEETKTGFKAIGLGLSVAALSFLFLFVVTAILTIFNLGDPFGTIAAFVIFFFYGLLIVGWLVVITGGLAGLMLYLLRLKILKNSNLELFQSQIRNSRIQI